jgi:hypothetical protein
LRGSPGIDCYGLKWLDYLSDEAEFSRRVIQKATPEQNLAAAVFGEAIEDLSRGPGATVEGVEVYESTREWVLSDDTSWPYSFVSLCDLFKLNVRAVREALLSSSGRRVHAMLRARMADFPRPVVARMNRGRRPSWWAGDKIPARR